jgi:hypothetical protein
VSDAQDRRLALLRADLGFLQLKSKAPELTLLHRWLDTWTGVGLIAVGVERQGVSASRSVTWPRGEWRARFMSSPMFAPTVQQAAWAAVKDTPTSSPATPP